MKSVAFVVLALAASASAFAPASKVCAFFSACVVVVVVD